MKQINSKTSIKGTDLLSKFDHVTDFSLAEGVRPVARARRMLLALALTFTAGAGFVAPSCPAWAAPTPTTPIQAAPQPATNSTTDPAADPALQQTVTEEESFAPVGQKVAITHGHIDLAPRFTDGGLSLLARDDSGPTPVWRSLDDMVFVLGPAAAQTLPETGYDFVGADAGQQVWAVGQTEVSGTPWLGWSTQAPSLIEKTTGPVKLTFEGHQGDGTFTNFLQSGNFGQPQVLFTSTQAQAQSISVDQGTHAHTNWVFTAPGVHLVRVSIQVTTREGQKLSVATNLRFAVLAPGGHDEQMVAQAHAAQWHGGARGRGAAVDEGTDSAQASADGQVNGAEDSGGPVNAAGRPDYTWYWLALGLAGFALLCLGGAAAITAHGRQARRAAAQAVNSADAARTPDIGQLQMGQPQVRQTQVGIAETGAPPIGVPGGGPMQGDMPQRDIPVDGQVSAHNGLPHPEGPRP